MNISLLIVCIGLGIATYHGVVTILDLFIKDKPRKPKVIHPVTGLRNDAAQTKRRMAQVANRHHRLRGIV